MLGACPPGTERGDRHDPAKATLARPGDRRRGLFLVAMAAQPAAATYPGSTNGVLAFSADVGGNFDLYTSLPGGQSSTD